MTNQNTDEMREAFERAYTKINPSDNQFNWVEIGELPGEGFYADQQHADAIMLWEAAASCYEEALREARELIGLAKNTGCQSYIEKAITTINKLLGETKC